MDLSKHKKPSLPRLTTNIPTERQSSVSLPPLPVKTQPQTKVQRPQSESKAVVPSLFPQEGQTDNENIAPALRYFQSTKPVYVVPNSVEEDDSPVAKKKTMYYEDAFAFRASPHPPKERIVQDSVVVAELTTNRRAKDGLVKLVSDLGFRLAQIYQRPETAIQVSVQSEVCLMLGNPSLPSYLLKIFALPSCIAPVTNLRNTNLIQSTLDELLGIIPEQGVILYFAVPEENLATNGMTVQGEITRLDQSEQSSPRLIKSISRTMSRRMKSSSGTSGPLSLPSSVITSSSSSQPNSNQSPTNTVGALPRNEEKRGRSLKKRGSLRNFVRRRLLDIKASKEDENNEMVEE
ncbi:Tautomerase [Penicillium macrosclerotiorum]|uniref:Tautomerase n=1 Tax=Penicillium macrosclerotiorum TaxID=303699 RepID=UPI002546C8AD|nr:Tautomerase [Penicillium macrosclerotiorum]KAJ5682945.1 Tautomerase [Penicillium macrosclerotiorum]